jgi:AraC family transcriptional regulator
MKDSFKKRFGQGPFPFPEEKAEQFVEFYDSNGLNIYLSRTATDFTAKDGYHSHDAYEFVIPSDAMPYTRVGDRCVAISRNSILPINSQQPHGPMGDMHIKRLMGAHVDREFLLDIAYQLFDVNEFSFRNEPLDFGRDIEGIMAQFIREARVRQAGHNFILECLSTQLVVKLLRLEKNLTAAEESTPRPEANKSINKVIEFLKENFASNDYSTKEIAKIANMSRYHFIRAFKNETGKTPYDYLIDIKIEKAKELLKDKDYSITEICSLCGFTSHSHFSTTFKKKLGVSPSKYRDDMD